MVMKRMKSCVWTALIVLFVSVAGAQLEIPNEAAWASSGHADSTSEAFRHWDGDDPPLVSPSCAKCHSGNGFRDFMGADGSTAGTVDNVQGLRQAD